MNEPLTPEGLTQRELLDIFDRTAAYPEIRAAIRRILKPEETLDAARPPDELRRHPNEPHEFRTTCQRCGAAGFLNVALITDEEIVRVEHRSLTEPVSEGEEGT